MDTDELIRQLDSNIKLSTEFVELGKALDRLSSNKDFIKVVKQGYFEQEAIRLVHLKADPSMTAADRQASIVSQIDAIGAFSAFLRKVQFEAGQAARNIETDEFTREELLSEAN